MIEKFDDIEKELQNCNDNLCNKIWKYKDVEMTSILFRNICQIILLDQLKPYNKHNFYEEFAKHYHLCENINDIKQKLLEII